MHIPFGTRGRALSVFRLTGLLLLAATTAHGCTPGSKVELPAWVSVSGAATAPHVEIRRIANNSVLAPSPGVSPTPNEAIEQDSGIELTIRGRSVMEMKGPPGTRRFEALLARLADLDTFESRGESFGVQSESGIGDRYVARLNDNQQSYVLCMSIYSSIVSTQTGAAREGTADTAMQRMLTVACGYRNSSAKQEKLVLKFACPLES